MNQQTFRQLHDALLNYEGESAYADVLLPWLEGGHDELVWLEAFSQRAGDPIPSATEEDLWALYALSRVCDLLILRFQDESADASWAGPQISAREFEVFIEALGLRVSRPDKYCAFYHEVVKVDHAIRPATQIITYRWPTVMLGNLLILRGGVEVTSPEAALRKGIADSTTLYWAYQRKARPYHDLSQGWGHNSQWRTAFRRDYLIDGVKFFNVDGGTELLLTDQKSRREVESAEGLTMDERIELLTNRCFVRSTKSHTDLFPYDDKFRMAQSSEEPARTLLTGIKEAWLRPKTRR